MILERFTNIIGQAFTTVLTFIGSIPEKDLFMGIMFIPIVFALGFLVYEIVTKGFGNDTV